MKWLLVAAVVLTTCAADVLQATEMQSKAHASLSDTLASVLRRPLLIASLLCMAASFGAFLLLLRHAELSFAVPATAVSFVLETALARWYLRERVDRRRWAASFLVAGGVALLAL